MTESKIVKPLSLKTFDDLTKLADFLKSSGLEEIDLDIDGTRLRLRMPDSRSYLSAPTVIPAGAPLVAPSQAKAEPSNAFKAPMVGTFYTSSSPESDAFVKVGDSVKKGQVICIIEAMKTMNQIESDRAGTVKSILATNAQPVEYGQPLFEIN